VSGPDSRERVWHEHACGAVSRSREAAQARACAGAPAGPGRGGGGSGGQEPDEAGEGARIIADVFLKAELPVPLPLAIPAGKDVTDFLKDGRTA
jgi:hypothetical protein